MDEYTMTCEYCGRVWDGNAQCPCPGNIETNSNIVENVHTEYYQKLHKDLQKLTDIDPDIDNGMIDRLLSYINSKLINES